MTIQEFAAKHHLKLRQPPKAPTSKPAPDRAYVPGKRGWITQQDKGSRFKVFIQSRQATHLLAAAKDLAMVSQGRCDTEIMLWFEPENPAHLDWVLRTVAARKKRQVIVTPELTERLRKMRGDT